jgi:hypothetical protein
MNIAVEFKIIDGKIVLYDKDGNILPGKGTHFDGNKFDCTYNKLTSLEGAPESVGGGFYCFNNKLTSLEGAPESVKGDFNCSHNDLMSLEGAPKSVGGSFNCSNNNLTSLKGVPKSVGGDFNCSFNDLTSLKGVPEIIARSFDCSRNNLTALEGAPESIGGNFNCSRNNLMSLEGAPKIIGGSFNCSNNNLTSLNGVPESIGRSFDCSYNKLTSLEGVPESIGGNFYCSHNDLMPKENQDMFEAFLAKGYVLADGILTKFKSKKNLKNGITIYKTVKLVKPEVVFVAASGDKYAHGKTAQKALLELEFKTSDRDVEQYRGLSLDIKKSPDEWSFIYRAITGACQMGTEMFMESKKLKKSYTLKEIITETENAYGHEEFVKIVRG